MNVVGLNHVNIRTTDVAASVQFYVNLFGFKHLSKTSIQSEPDNWLYDASGSPIIHFRIMESDATSAGPVDHVALTCRNKPLILERLQAHNIQYVVNDGLASEGITQVYLRDPHGLALELNFNGE